MHGYVFQAIGPDGTTAADLGRRLGVSKQAAGKTIDTLERLGYVERGADPVDARRKIVRLTDRGTDCLARSARIFDRLRADWAVRSAKTGSARWRPTFGGDTVGAVRARRARLVRRLVADMPGMSGIRARKNPTAGDGGCTSDRALAKGNKPTCSVGVDCSPLVTSCDWDHSRSPLLQYNRFRVPSVRTGTMRHALRRLVPHRRHRRIPRPSLGVPVLAARPAHHAR